MLGAQGDSMMLSGELLNDMAELGMPAGDSLSP